MNETTSPGKSKTGLIAAIAVLIVLAIMFVVVLKLYRNESDNRSASITPDTAQTGENRIDASAKIVSADPVKGDVVVRLEFTPHGNFAAEDGVTLNRDLELFVNSANGKQSYEFRKGKRMNPVEAVLDMYNGDAMDYPFDEHEAALEMYFQPGTAATPDASAGGAAIPVAFEMFGAASGLEIEAEKAKENTADYVSVDLSVKRAATARFFSFFIMSAMWLITVAVIFLAFHILTDRRKIEIGMFSFLGALLFAFPALRNSQPGTPPIGTYGDFMAFFWAEMLIALCLLVVLSTWLIRGPGGAGKA